MKIADKWKVRLVTPDDAERGLIEVPIWINPQPFYTDEGFRGELIEVASAIVRGYVRENGEEVRVYIEAWMMGEPEFHGGMTLAYKGWEGLATADVSPDTLNTFGWDL